VEEDQIGLYAHGIDPAQDPFKALPEGKAGFCHVPGPVLFLFKSIKGGLVMVIGVILGEEAEADLVEGSLFQALQSFFHQIVLLMGQGIDRGPEGNEGMSVRIYEMGIFRPYRSMVSLLCGKTDLLSPGGEKAGDFPSVQARLQGQEADLINPFSVIKALYLYLLPFPGKYGPEGKAGILFFQGRIPEDQFKDSVLLHKI
jgi:hypothetical protein